MRLLAPGLLVALAVVLSAAGPSRATYPATQQRLLILSESSGFASLELLGPGKQVIDLDTPVGVLGSGAISADGTQIAINASVPLDPADPTSAELSAGDWLGTKGGIVAHNAALGGRPTWSPDGTRVAFAARTSSGKFDVYVAAADGSGAPADLTNDPGANDRNPRWAPNGSAIAFESDRTGNWDVFTMQTDGSQQADLTSNAADDRLGDWSPGSDKLVFSSTRSGGGDLYVMPGAGGAATQLTSGPGADTHAAWSPDGTTIAYSNDAGGSANVWEIAPDGSNQVQLTHDDFVNYVQDWQPLTDSTAPVTHALASKGKRKHPAVLRFKVTEASGKAAVVIDLPGRQLTAIKFINSVNPAHVYSIGLPYRFLGHKPPASFRFCVQAIDASLNEGANSCARYRFVKK
ncbi:MAG: TolB family protein [Gaiellaceae bacterium]